MHAAVQIMIQSKKYFSGKSSQQSVEIITEKMQQQMHLVNTGKVKLKVQHSVNISTKVEMASAFQSSVKFRKEEMKMIQNSAHSKGHTINAGRQLMLPSKVIKSTVHDSDRKRVESKGQGQNTRPERKSSSHRSVTCHTSRNSATKSSREEQKSTETRKTYYRKP